MQRESWKTQMGFICAAVGSAVGLANIWRFPYVVGNNGGAAFIIVYLLCVFIIGIPVFASEVIIGRKTHKNPQGAFRVLGKNSKFWSSMGLIAIATGLIVSAFYSVVAGWILGYLFEAINGSLIELSCQDTSKIVFYSHIQNTGWIIGFHFCFIIFCMMMLMRGVRRGIEWGNKLFMPVFFCILVILIINGLIQTNSSEGLKFLFSPDWSKLTPTALMIALGHSFFTLSSGQGTMIAYGSYLSDNTNIVKSSISIALSDTLISMLVAIAIFTVAFSVGIEPSCGPGLVFHTLPVIFSKIAYGNIMAILFFLLVTLAAITSEISAMEPLISYLIDENGLRRENATIITAIVSFILGVPLALSFGVLNKFTICNKNFFELAEFVSTNVMIPIGGLFAVLLVGWKLGFDNAYDHLKKGSKDFLKKFFWLKWYFWVCIKYVVPALIVLVFINAIGIL